MSRRMQTEYEQLLRLMFQILVWDSEGEDVILDAFEQAKETAEEMHSGNRVVH